MSDLSLSHRNKPLWAVAECYQFLEAATKDWCFTRHGLVSFLLSCMAQDLFFEVGFFLSNFGIKSLDQAPPGLFEIYVVVFGALVAVLAS